MTSPSAFFRRSIGRRLSLIVLIIALGMAGTLALTSREVSNALFAEKGQETRRLVETAHSLVAAYQRIAAAGKMTEAAAKDEALDRLSQLRYDGQQYFWVNDLDGKMLMHPTAPDLVGTSIIELRDARGDRPFRGMIDLVRKQGAGAYEYYWPPQGEAHPKESYVKGVDGWGWVIGSGVYVDDIQGMVDTTLLHVAGATAVTLVIVVVLAGFVGRGISRPLAGITGAMKELAAGNHAVEIPGRDRLDEIGTMAAAVEVFKQNAVDAARLDAAQKSEQAVKEARQSAVQRHIAAFEGKVRASLEALGLAAREMRATSEGMSATAEHASTQAATVATLTDQASANVQTVASATEELSSSVAEIGRQVDQSTDIARKAVDEADRTNTSVSGLSTAAQKIGDVVKLISDIASQTNLLALNATIEAARAGEAGKGFAVVATEVKSLADQTAKATDEIAAQVAAMQGATGDAVQAIKGIGATIGTINQIAATIAAAVKQQGEATQDISRNVHQASHGTGEVSTTIGGVSKAAADTGTAAAAVLGAAEALGRQAETLRSDVDRFLADIRAA